MPLPSSRIAALLVAGTAAMVLFVQLGNGPLWDDDEPKNAACSAAMLDSGDWVVPRFNERLRIEKPPLVNWLQMAGFALCGVNEWGARISSAVLTIGTCLLTWRIGIRLFGHASGLLGGLAMASCIWTAIGGRAATPDAALVFCTTLGAFFFVRDRFPAPNAPAQTERGSPGSSLGLGVATGLAVLAKGPIGILLPLASLLLWELGEKRLTPCAQNDAGLRSRLAAAIVSLRLHVVLAIAAMVAGPWYAWVTWRTNGSWLSGFFLIHNVERFTTSLEGHSGSVLYYPVAIAMGLYPWSIVLLAVVIHLGWELFHGDAARQRSVRFLVSWAFIWIGFFSCASTKLPGYVWPAYPVLAIGTGVFFDDWRQKRLNWEGRSGLSAVIGDRVMTVAWACLAAGGLAIAGGLAWIGTTMQGTTWLALIGCLPILAACLAGSFETRGRRDWAVGTLALSAVGLLVLLGGCAAGRLAHLQGVTPLLVGLPHPATAYRWASLETPPPSLVFYARSSVELHQRPASAIGHLTADADRLLVIPSRLETVVVPLLPSGFGILGRKAATFDGGFTLVGPIRPTAWQQLAKAADRSPHARFP